MIKNCEQCGEEYINIGHPLQPGVIMQRVCACVLEVRRVENGAFGITRPPTKEEREAFRERWSTKPPKPEESTIEKLFNAAEWIPPVLENAQLKLDVMRYRTELGRLHKLLGDVLERSVNENEMLLKSLREVMKALKSREWITESRGAYEWNDDKYKEEAHNAFVQVIYICDAAVRASVKQRGLYSPEAWEFLERLSTELGLDKPVP